DYRFIELVVSESHVVSVLVSLCCTRGLSYSHRVFFVEPKNLARHEADCCLWVANLYSIQLHASLFNEPRGVTAGLLDVECFPVNARNQADGVKLVQWSR